jgi:tRNA pseudouridine55 synthase
MSHRINDFVLLQKPIEIGDDDSFCFEQGVFILIDKPQQWTSFDVVNKIRRMTKTKKTGHCGTLDPLATGLLIVATGKATKSIDTLTNHDKTYETDITLGIETDSYDTDGEMISQQTVPDIHSEDWKNILQEWVGDIQQVPPVFSALKKNGVPLYKMARKGKTIQLEPRPVTVYRIDVLSWQKPVLKLFIHCAKGTYIRSIAHDIGKRIGCGASVSALRRTKIGQYSVMDALTLPAFQSWIETKKVPYAVH